MKAPCPRCSHVHPADAAVAIGRFSLGRDVVYRASNRDDAPTCTTRAEAVADWCDRAGEARTS